jgi:uncharacterized protein
VNGFFSPFQPAYLLIGAFFVAASHKARLHPTLRGMLLVTVGAIVVAAGVGLVPYVVKSGPAVWSVASVAAVVGGIVIVVSGARTMLHARRGVQKLTGGVATVMAVVVLVWMIAPAVAATNVPDTHVRSTPAAVGLRYESVTLTTNDGVKLAAWYVRGTNGGGVVVMHGSGSTRSDVVDQAAALSAGGYAVLLVDARHRLPHRRLPTHLSSIGGGHRIGHSVPPHNGWQRS